MAHILKVSVAGVRGVLKHCARTEEAENPNVDRSLTGKNVNLTVDCINLENGGVRLKYHSIPGEEVERRYIERMKGVRSMKRADVKALVSLIVTAPEGLTDEQNMLFLRRCVGYAADRFGTKNVIAGCVHLDEPGARPHVHVLITPVIEAEKKGERFEKLCCKKFLTKEDYTQLHANLERFAMKYGKLPKVELTNGITKAAGGNRSVSQLKYDSAMAAIEKRQAELDHREAELDKREAKLNEREQLLNGKAAQADVDFLSRMAKMGFSGDEIQVFKIIPREQWEIMRESLIFADRPGKERMEKLAAEIQYEKRNGEDHVIASYPVMTGIRPIWKKLGIFEKENRDFQLLPDRKVDKRIDVNFSSAPSKEEALAAFCGGKDVLNAWRKEMRKAAVEKTFQRFGITAAKTWAYDRER